MLELINLFEKSTGVKLNYEIAEDAPEILKRYGQILIMQIMNWDGKPEISIEETLKSAWAWQLKLRERGIQ